MAVGLGDWNYPKSIQFDTCPLELSTSCYYMLMADIMADFSLLLSNGKENKYKVISAKTKENILKCYKYLIGRGFSYEEADSAISNIKNSVEEWNEY